LHLALKRLDGGHDIFRAPDFELVNLEAKLAVASTWFISSTEAA